MNQGFPASEKLKSKVLIEHVFSRGKSVKKFPVRLLYYPLPKGANTHQVGIAVPKRNFKRAVDRNLLKRRLRESYRTQKEVLSTLNNRHYALLFLYLGKEKKPFPEIKKAVKATLTNISTYENL